MNEYLKFENVFFKHQGGLSATDEFFCVYLDELFRKEKNNILLVTNSLYEANKLYSNLSVLNDNVVLLGCTELPIIYELCKDKINKDVYDPLEFSIDYLKEKQNDENNIYKNSKVKKLV